MSKKKEITAPTLDAERELSNILNDKSDTYVQLRGKRIKVKYPKKGAIRKLTDIMLAKDNDDTASCQAAAVMRLNSFWKIILFYPILWRWMFFVKEYQDEELFPLIAAYKKKVPLESYYINTTLLIDMKDTMMMMRKEEVSSFRQEQIGEIDGKSQKNTNG